MLDQSRELVHGGSIAKANTHHAGAWLECRAAGRDEHALIDSASASHRGAAASLLNQSRELVHGGSIAKANTHPAGAWLECRAAGRDDHAVM